MFRQCKDNRWIFRWVLLYPTVGFYILLYLLSDWITIKSQSNDVLASIVVGNFACNITAVSIFVALDLEKSKALLTAESKLWFVDAICIALCDLLFCLVFLNNSKSSLIFVVILSCYHTYIVFHYYLWERFNRNKKNACEKNSVQTNAQHKFVISNDKKKPYTKTIVDTIMILGPVLYFLFVDQLTIVDNASVWKLCGFVAIFSANIVLLIIVKEKFLEDEMFEYK
ncbi:MAG: hypothetical protein LBK70_02740 [Clostridiales bacterium]|jgi:hypothetical protein|nr:hypothetical protein [Clostridiales bacterium]